MDLRALTDDARADMGLAMALADAADARTLPALDEPGEPARKADGSLVTPLDVDVERVLRTVLARERPGDRVIGEEQGGDDGWDRGRAWTLDPLDHTANHVRGLPVFATLVSLLDDGVPQVGVVSAPALGWRWWAARGAGAWARATGRTAPRRLSVSGVARLEDAHVSVAGLQRWADRGRLDGVVGLLRATRFVHGSGGFPGQMWVAGGHLDVSLDPWGEVWDLAAPQVIVEEAGGRVTDLAGVARPAGGAAIVTNGRVHDAVLERLSESRGAV